MSEPAFEEGSATLHGMSVLVIGAGLDDEAQALLDRHGLKTIYVSAYASPEEIVHLVERNKVDAIIARRGAVDARVIDASPRLRVISKHGTGVDGIDLAAASSRGIPVLRALAANAQSVAEFAISLAVAGLKDLHLLDQAVKSGRWPTEGYKGRDMAGASIGLIGYGEIGRRVAGFARALGMSVSVHSPRLDPQALPSAIAYKKDLGDLLSSSDIVSLHCPLTEDTRHLLDERRIGMMRAGSFLVNTARGALVDENALIRALRDGPIAGAALDCFEEEPLPADHPLRALPNVILTPHAAGTSRGAIRNMGIQSVNNVLDVLLGREINRKALAVEIR